MPSTEKIDLWLKILAIVLIIALSGISPYPHRVKEAMMRVGQRQNDKITVRDAQDLVLIAEQQPWREGLWEQSGYVAFKTDELELALYAFKKAAAAGTLSLKGYQAFGDAYLAAGKPEIAAQIWQAGIKIHHPSEDILVRVAEVQRTMDDFPGLRNTLRALLDLEGTDLGLSSNPAQINHELGVLLALENPSDATPYLRRAVDLDPSLSEAGALAFTIQRALTRQNPTYTLTAVGRELANQNRWDLAAKAFQKVTALQPEYGEGWAYLGEALQHLDGETSENALRALETALSLEPKSLSANIFMALYWKRVGDLDRHLYYLTQASEIDPGNPSILVDLGEASAILGDLDRGYDYHLQAIELSYQDPTYLRALVVYCIRYNYSLQEIALPTARQAVIADRANPATLDVMGQVLFRLGDLLTAQRFYLRALGRDPEYAPAYVHLGLVYNLQGQPDRAADAFAKAIALAPDTLTAFQAERLFDQMLFP